MYGPSPQDDLRNYGMIELYKTMAITYDTDVFEKAFAEIFEAKPEIVKPECKNDAPIDCDRAHQATHDLCRGGK